MIMKREIFKDHGCHFIRDDGNTEGEHYSEIEYVTREHKPSWKRYGTGSAILRLATHTGNPYLMFDVEEISRGDKAVHSKRTMVTLDAETAKHVVAWIKEKFPDA